MKIVGSKLVSPKSLETEQICRVSPYGFERTVPNVQIVTPVKTISVQSSSKVIVALPISTSKLI